MGRVTIDVVTYDSAADSFKMVLVEEGPWESGATEEHLRALQQRLYDCVDAAIDGHLAGEFPDSRGKDVVIQLDCYDTPDEAVSIFFGRFRDHVSGSSEIQADIKRQGFVRSLRLEYNRCSLKGRDA
jgi:hypothetical protein